MVFDGWNSGNLSQRSYMARGIKVIYTKQGEVADSVIKRIAEKSKRELVIVTSDMEIKTFAEKCGKIVISSPEFLDKIDMARYFSMKGGVCEDDPEPARTGTKKKGNPRRQTRKERKKKRRLDKL